MESVKDKRSILSYLILSLEDKEKKRNNRHEGWLHQRVWRARPPDLADLSCTWTTASPRSSVRCADRRRAGFELPGRAAPAVELCCRCFAAGRVARARLLSVSSLVVAS